MIKRLLSSQDIIFDTLLPIAEQRCQERDNARLGRPAPKHVWHLYFSRPGDYVINSTQSDCIQWIMETSPRQSPWSPSRVVHELMAIWFGSVHALSTVSSTSTIISSWSSSDSGTSARLFLTIFDFMQTIVFAVHDLCLHPEYVAPLRIELERDYAQFERTSQGLHLLDSFIKESARLTPVEASKSCCIAYRA